MTRTILCALALGAVVFAVFAGCESKTKVDVPPVLQAPVQIPAPQMPVAPVVAPPPAPVAPPPTPLVPVAEEVATSGGTGSGGGGASVDKALPGKKTTGEELAGNYSCQVDFAIGPLKAPAFDCVIRAKDDGGYKVTSSGGGRANNFGGNITNSTTAGFLVEGAYNFRGQKLDLKGRLVRQGAKQTYSGKCRGTLNGDKSTQQSYKVTMTKK